MIPVPTAVELLGGVIVIEGLFGGVIVELLGGTVAVESCDRVEVIDELHAYTYSVKIWVKV